MTKKTIEAITIAESKLLVDVSGEKSESFMITKGLCQSGALFSIFLEMIIRAVNINTIRTIWNKALQILEYADDLYIITVIM